MPICDRLLLSAAANRRTRSSAIRHGERAVFRLWANNLKCKFRSALPLTSAKREIQAGFAASCPDRRATLPSIKAVNTMGIEIGGVLGFILLIAVIWALVNVLRSHASIGAKVVWCAAILLLPLLGFVCWLIFGPRSAKR